MRSFSPAVEEARPAITRNETHQVDGLSASCPHCRELVRLLFIRNKFIAVSLCRHYHSVTDGAIWFQQINSEASDEGQN